MKKESWSCESLHYAIYAAPDVLRNCCKRFFVDGKLKGDVEVLKVTSNKDISYDSIRDKKAKLYKDINAGKETPCSGCPWLVKKDWPELNKLKLRLVSIEHHSVCNLRCTYCSDMYYGGKKPSYNVNDLFTNLSEASALDENLSLIWGGGEPVIYGEFEKLFSSLTDKFTPKSNHVFSNAIKYSLAIEKSLREGRVTLTVSLDAGTSATFVAVRGRNRFFEVLENLTKYSRAGGDRVIIKYILTEENSSSSEIHSFINVLKKYGLESCSFQISADFKDEVISDQLVEAAKLLYEGLRSLNIKMINFDYHLRPRILQIDREVAVYDKASQFSETNVIIWGAGEYALRLLENRFLKENIRFFVDSDQRKQGRELGGVPIYAPSKILSENDPLIFIASSQFYSEIYNKIIEMGVSLDNIIDADSI